MRRRVAPTPPETLMNKPAYTTRTRSRRRRGAAVLEAALVLPLLMIVIFGAIEFGYAFFVKHSLQNAARTGARRAVVADSNAEVQTNVDDALRGMGLGNISKTVRIVDMNGNNVNVATIGEGRDLIVIVDANWNQFSAFIAPFTGVNLGTLRGQVVMRRER